LLAKKFFGGKAFPWTLFVLTMFIFLMIWQTSDALCQPAKKDRWF